jgi:succinoglycan biosynthesis transport protein ExoP
MGDPAKAFPLIAGTTSRRLVHFWRILRKGWFIVLAVMIAVTGAVTFYTLTAPKIYQASASLVLDPQPTRPLGTRVETGTETAASSYLGNREYYATEQEIATSERLRLATVRRLRLHHDRAFLLEKPGGAVEPKPVQSEQAAAKLLRERLSAQFSRESRVLTLRLEDANPDRAKKILSTLVDLYTEQNLDTSVQASTAAADWLEGQLGKLKAELQDSELSLHRYKLDNNILSVSLDDQSSMLREEMSRLNGLLTDARAKREQVGARKQALESIPEDDPSNVPATELLSNVLLSQYRKQYVDTLSEQEALLKSGRGENHPDVRAIAARVATTRHALVSEINNVVQSVTREYQSVSKEIGGLAGLLENARKRAFEVNLLEIDYNRLSRTKQNTEKLYSLVLERAKELDLTRMMRFNNIRILDVPTVQEDPIKPRVPANLALGVLAGLGLGIAAALGRDRMDRTIKTPDDAEEALDVPALGLLPAVGLGSKGRAGRRESRRASRRAQRRSETPEAAPSPIQLYVHDHPTSGLAEAARAIRTNILFTSPDRPFKLLLVTSPGPSEGKTTVACCVATAMAQAGQRVLLVDCDMRRPQIHRVFGKKTELGVSSTLLELDSLKDAVVPTDIPNLSILPCGPIPPNPSELLHSAAFEKLLEVLLTQYDRIIIDSPPIGPVTDAAILSTRVDGTIFVVRAYSTSRDLADRALRALRSVGGRVIGVVLNDVDLSRSEYGYHQYYYFRYYRSEGYHSTKAS